MTNFQTPSPKSVSKIPTLATGATVALIGKITGRVFNILGQIFLARFLGPSGFGLYIIGLTIVRLLSTITPLGLDRGTLQFGSRYWKQDNQNLRSLLFQTIGLSSIVGTFAGIIIFICTPWIAQQYQNPNLVAVLRLFALSFPLQSGLRVASAATRISQRMKYAVLAEEISQPAVHVIFMIPMSFLIGERIFGSIIAYVISLLFAFILTLHYIRKLFPEILSPAKIINGQIKEILIYSLPTSITGMFTVLLMWSDRLWIGYFWSEADVGIYQTAAQVATIFVIIVGSFGAILSPIIAKFHYNKEYSQLNDLYKVSTRWGIYLSMPIFLVICFTSRNILTTIFGPEYANGANALIIIAIGQMINLATGTVGPMLMMTENQNRWFLTSMGMLLINVLLNWLLVKELGIIGAAISSAVTIGGLYIIGLIQLRLKLKVWPYNAEYIKILISTCITILALILVNIISEDRNFWYLLTNLITSVSIFGITMLVLGINSDDRAFIGSLQYRLAKGFNNKK